MKKVETKTESPVTHNWITEAEAQKLADANGSIELCQTESLTTPGKKLQFFVKPPDTTAYAASMRYITNAKENTNDVMTMQQSFYDFCFVIGEPALMEELKDESLKARHIFQIGKVVGDAFPLPEVEVLKKSYRKQN